jgi:hypothetical protein
MDIRWFADLPPERQEDFKKLVLNSQVVLGKLSQILDDEERNLDRQEASVEDFNSSAWPYKQAFRNGERSRIRKMRDLLSFVRR